MSDAEEAAREVLGCRLTLADDGRNVCETEHGGEWDCADEEKRIADLIRERDAEVADLLAEVDRLRAGIEAMHRPVLPVFSWRDGLRFDDPCPECHGKAGVHPCGCWADEDAKFECLECAQPKGGGSRRVSPWPCATAALLNPTEGDQS